MISYNANIKRKLGPRSPDTKRYFAILSLPRSYWVSDLKTLGYASKGTAK